MFTATTIADRVPAFIPSIDDAVQVTTRLMDLYEKRLRAWDVDKRGPLVNVIEPFIYLEEWLKYRDVSATFDDLRAENLLMVALAAAAAILKDERWRAPLDAEYKRSTMDAYIHSIEECFEMDSGHGV